MASVQKDVAAVYNGHMKVCQWSRAEYVILMFTFCLCGQPLHLFAVVVLARWGLCPTAGACHSTSVIPLWLLPSTQRVVVSCSYDDGWAADIAWMSLMATW